MPNTPALYSVNRFSSSESSIRIMREPALTALSSPDLILFRMVLGCNPVIAEA